MNRSSFKATAVSTITLYLAIILFWGKELNELLKAKSISGEIIVLGPIMIAATFHLWLIVYDYFEKE